MKKIKIPMVAAIVASAVVCMSGTVFASNKAKFTNNAKTTDYPNMCFTDCYYSDGEGNDESNKEIKQGYTKEFTVSNNSFSITLTCNVHGQVQSDEQCDNSNTYLGGFSFKSGKGMTESKWQGKGSCKFVSDSDKQTGAHNITCG